MKRTDIPQFSCYPDRFYSCLHVLSEGGREKGRSREFSSLGSEGPLFPGGRVRVIDPGGKRAQSDVFDRRVREGMGNSGFVLSSRARGSRLYFHLCF